MIDPLAVLYVLLLGATLAAAIVFDARRRKGRRSDASLATPDAGPRAK